MKRDIDHLSDKTICLINERFWSDERVIEVALDFLAQKKLVEEFEKYVSFLVVSEASGEGDDGNWDGDGGGLA